MGPEIPEPLDQVEHHRADVVESPFGVVDQIHVFAAAECRCGTSLADLDLLVEALVWLQVLQAAAVA